MHTMFTCRYRRLKNLSWKDSSSFAVTTSYRASVVLSPIQTNSRQVADAIVRLPFLSLQHFSSESISTKKQENFEKNDSSNNKVQGQDRSALARLYNQRRDTYKKTVTSLRKQYAEEIQTQILSEQTKLEEQRAIIKRARLERQRLKNIESAKNALRQEESRRLQQIEFEKKLAERQVQRQKKEELMNQARMLLLQELEEESKAWMTSVDEVERMFSSPSPFHVEQKLWARPGGFIGAPSASIHDEFWRLESHTWDMSRTYPSPRDLLLEDIQEFAYQQSNMPSSYWTQERVTAQNELEEKAKLRALVREEGRKSLLLQQRQWMQDSFAIKAKEMGQKFGLPDKTNFPLEMPTPSLKILGNYSAMEREGVKILETDPTRFFLFENDAGLAQSAMSANVTSDGDTAPAVVISSGDDSSGDDNKDPSGSASFMTLGKPVGLRDPIRDATPTNTPYPQLVGRLPKADTRTEREKKRDEKKERMWAAAATAGGGSGVSSAVASKVEFAAEDDLKNIGGSSEPLDYNVVGNRGDDDDVAWEEEVLREVEQEKDRAELLETPREQRYTESDVDWIIEQLEKKIKGLEDMLKFEEESAHRSLNTHTISTTNQTSAGSNPLRNVRASTDVVNVDEPNDGNSQVDDVIVALGKRTVKSTEVDERGRDYTSYTILDDDDGIKFDELPAIKEIQSILDTLTPTQIAALEALGDEQSVSAPEKHDTTMAQIEMKNILSKVPGLSEDQIQALIDLESSLAKNSHLLDDLGIFKK